MTEPSPVATPFIVTIDGLAASGKSSVARLVARQLQIPYVSSGLVYRAAAVAALTFGVDPDDEAGLVSMLEAHDVRLLPLAQGNRVTVDGRDVTDRAQTTPVDAAVSLVARHPRVRDWVNALLKRLPGSFVAEGRDMGSAVFPGAAVKLYLTAPAAVRAGRRVSERSGDLPAIQAGIERRDAIDARNSHPAPDAVQLDTSSLNLEGVVQAVLGHVKKAVPGEVTP